MAVGLEDIQALASPAVEQPNTGASYGDLLKGLFTHAATRAIDKELGTNNVVNPESTAPKGNLQTNVDTGVGEQQANSNLKSFVTQNTLLAAGIAVGATALLFLLAKAVK